EATGPPGTISPERYASVSTFYFAAVRKTFGRNPVAFMLSSAAPEFGRWARAHPKSVVAPGVAVVRGPVSATPLSVADNAPPFRPPGAAALVVIALAGLLGFGLVGAGWASASMGRWLEPVEIAAIGPAV